MILETFILTPFEQNTRVVACERTREALCIDPGEPSQEMVNYINDNDLDLKVIALTHGHLDHIGGTAYLHKHFPAAEILLHEGDNDYYYGLPRQPLMMGVAPHQLAELGMDYEDPPPLTRSFRHGEMLEIGDLRFSVRHCPGHTAGHVVLALESEKTVFTGDCLFSGTIGRTDLPGGNYDQLIASIREHVLRLGDDFTVYCGHGPDTTIGRERETNPFLTGASRFGNPI
jgi:hydroxyacylglutathione hydrolase